MEALGEGVEDAGGRPCVVEGQEEGPLLDPLKIELVFDNILRSLPFKDLCSARLVSKEWYKGSQPLWLDKAPRKKLYIPCFGEPDADGVTSFLHEFHDPSHTYSEFEWKGVREYRKFRVEFPLGEVPDDVDKEELQEFVTQAGAWVKHLQLTFTVFSDFDMLRDILSCQLTPCLESLGIDINFAYGAPRWRGQNPPEYQDQEDTYHQSRLKSLHLSFGETNQEIFPFHWLFQHPNLEDLTLGCYSARKEFPLQFAQNVLRQISELDNQKFSLKKLEIYGIPFDGPIACNLLLEFFQESKLPLESLSVEVGNYGDSPNLVHDLMTLLSPSLKAFKVKRIPAGSAFHELRPPFMEFLREFRVDGHFFTSLAFLKKFPNLRVLELKGDELAGPAGLIAATKDEDLLAEFEMKFLTDFSYHQLDELEETCSPEDFPKLKRWMPNLTKLSMRLSKDTFRMTCEFWPLLEWLQIDGTEIQENVITGRTPDGSIPMSPKISSLKKLKYIKLSGYDDTEDNPNPLLSNFSLLCTLIRLPSLESFCIGRNHVDEDEMAKLRRVIMCWIQEQPPAPPQN